MELIQGRAAAAPAYVCTELATTSVLCAEVTVSVYHRPTTIADTQRSGRDDGVPIKAKHLHDDFGSGGAVSSAPER